MFRDHIGILTFKGTMVRCAEEDYNSKSLFFFGSIILYNILFFVE